ncbi:MAG: hypothetical protein SO164_08335 [Campylobacter sp.]|uniref:hypothetical protein n=2 Tax=Campylobacter sp. TaxID=205 RepID=UPI002A80B849|nr:hypothetical protein [Campylobacter sp.]MCI7582231.1 hypothetical protein [Campylobacter sp.]MDY4803609.1 hypothetical protein [Campylobacter sp.]MDY4830799.1 hypothetical protein [Campylobacter sp.]
MTEQTKAVFSDPKLLREKLNEFLQTPEKVEIYAQAAEKFFLAGNGQKIKAKPTWSWWGLIGSWWFLFYRKDNVNGLIMLLIAGIGSRFIANLGFIVPIVIGMYAKYYVIKRFEKALDNNELESKSGVAKWAIYVGIIGQIVTIIVSAMIFSGNLKFN